MKNHTAGLLLIHGDSAEDFLSPHFLYPFSPTLFPAHAQAESLNSN